MDVTAWTLFRSQDVRISLDMNPVPLSNITYRGMPNIVKSERSTLMTTAKVE